MFKNYFKVAFRVFNRNRLITFINVFGLGLAMTVGMMVMIRMQEDMSYDNFHPQSGSILRIISAYYKKSGEQWRMATTSLPLRQQIEGNFKNVQAVANVYPALSGKIKVDGKEFYLNGAFTEPSFFDIFGFTFHSGNPSTALKEPNTIVISQTAAKKYFGNENPLGKLLMLETGENFIVTGVLNAPPSKTHFNYEAFASWASVKQMEDRKTLAVKSSDWFALNAAYTFVKNTPHGNKSGMDLQLKNLATALNKNNTDGEVTFTAQEFDKISPSGEMLGNEMNGVSPWGKIIAEIIIAAVILLAACFNYTNLTVARALSRAKEVGIRKIAGARRVHVFVQYLIEAILLSMLALCLAWIFLSLIIRYAPFNDEYEFIPSAFRYNSPFVMYTIASGLFAGLLAGIAPAWMLSAFTPLRVMKNLTTAKIMGKVSIQKALIVFQYSLSLFIIIFLLTFYRQFSFMGKADRGFAKDNIMVVPLNGLKAERIIQEINSIAGIHSSGAMSAEISKKFSGMSMPAWTDDPQKALKLQYYFADPGFIPTMQLKVLAGNNFPASATRPAIENILINEQAAIGLGFKDYEKAIGQLIRINDTTQMRITGILKNFNYEDPGRPVFPLAFRTLQDAYNYVYISIENNADKQAIALKVASTLQTSLHCTPILTSWLDEDLKRANDQTATISLLGYLAFIATAIATLGLLGLVTYTVQVKRKEISIRKIIGATEKQLASMLSGRFIKLIFIAGFIAVPIGFMAGHLFLQNFVERTTDSLLSAFLCFAFLLCIGLTTIISQTLRAAATNPVKDLHTE
jgi:putative ABC transport system permease protein